MWIDEFIKNWKEYAGSATVVGLLAYIAGTKKRKLDNQKTAIRVTGEKIETMIKVDEYNDKKWSKMSTENIALREALEAKDHKLEEMKKEYKAALEKLINDFTTKLNTLQHELHDALIKIEEQQVIINANKFLE